jgi:hypothetical protein
MISSDEKVLPEEDKMLIPFVLDDSKPANTLMTLTESKGYKQQLGKGKNKQAHQALAHMPASEPSDVDETPHPCPCSHPAYAQVARATISEPADADEIPHHHPRPHRRLPHAQV